MPHGIVLFILVFPIVLSLECLTRDTLRHNDDRGDDKTESNRAMESGLLPHESPRSTGLAVGRRSIP